MIKAVEPAVPAARSGLDKFVDFVSSVRFGVTLLCILVVLAMIGMLIMQQNVAGFDTYYVSLTPAEKLVFGGLGIFDIYGSWYFNGVLLLLSLNIVLASIDHFPAAWTFISKPKLDASRKWLLGQKQNAVVTLASPDQRTAAQKVQATFCF